MNTVLWYVGMAVSGLILFALQKHAVTKPGNDLAHKFAALGTLAGRSKLEIIEAVGQPTSVSSLVGNQMLFQWQATGYHIALLFTGEVCDGVTHEHLAQSA